MLIAARGSAILGCFWPPWPLPVTIPAGVKAVFQKHFHVMLLLCRTVKVTVAGEEKFTAAAKGKDAAIDETLEFILGRKEINEHEDLSVDIEVWDYRLINHFKVQCFLYKPIAFVLKDTVLSPNCLHSAVPLQPECSARS